MVSPDIRACKQISYFHLKEDIVRAEAAHTSLVRGDYADAAGWVNNFPDIDELAPLYKTAARIQKTDVLLVLGAGGSYLSAQAAIEFIQGPYYNQTQGNWRQPEIYFIGNSFSQRQLLDILHIISGRTISIIIVSKSGETLEPLLFLNHLEPLTNKENIIAITGMNTKLYQRAQENNWETYIFPETIGGRFSILTPSALLPMVCANININKVIEGARLQSIEFRHKIIYYSAARNYFLNQGFSKEVLAIWNIEMLSLGEWWKQLIGESENKNGNGLFPIVNYYSRDLHSIGQAIQDGKHDLFETHLIHEFDSDNGKEINEMNEKAINSAISAHSQVIPCIPIYTNSIKEEALGSITYFFQMTTSISAIARNINPFDQPGVEFYKKNLKNF